MFKKKRTFGEVCQKHIERLSSANVMLRATLYKGTAQLLSLT